MSRRDDYPTAKRAQRYDDDATAGPGSAGSRIALWVILTAFLGLFFGGCGGFLIGFTAGSAVAEQNAADHREIMREIEAEDAKRGR